MSANNFEGDPTRGPIIDTPADASAIAPADTRQIQFIVESFSFTALVSEYDAGEPQIVLSERIVLRCLGETATIKDKPGEKKEVTVCPGGTIEVDLATEQVIRPDENIPDQRRSKAAEADVNGDVSDTVAVTAAPSALLLGKVRRQVEQHLYDWH